MDSGRLIGIGIMAVCIVIAIIYFGLMFLGYGIEVVKVVVSVAFVAVLTIGGWIGWTMASTPTPEPAEDFNLDEIEDEEFEEPETPEDT